MPAQALKLAPSSPDDFVDEAIAEVRREMATSDRDSAFLTAEIMRAIGNLSRYSKPIWNEGEGVGPLALAVALSFHLGCVRDKMDGPLQETVEALTQRFRALALRYGRDDDLPPSLDAN